MSDKPIRLLHDTLTASASRHPDKAALITDGKVHTYRELHEAARRFAQALRDRGLGRGDRVAIFMDNGFPATVAIYGTLMAGGVFLVINPQTKSDKLSFVLDDSGAAILATEQSLGRVFTAVVGGRPHLRAVICRGVPANVPDQAPTFVEFDEELARAEPLSQNPGTIPVDLGALIYTSGSTGHPKGVMMTHQSMVFTSGSLVEYIRLGPEDRIIGILPLAFDYGLYQLLMSVSLGATLVLARSFAYPAKVLAQVGEHQVTVFPGVPTIYAMLVSMHHRHPLCFPTVTRVTNTAAALPGDYVTALQEIFPNALIFRMYGQTECKRVCYLEPELLHEKPGSVGKAIPGTEVFLRSPEGDPVPPGEIGILHVRGPHVMLGYWNAPEKSREVLIDGELPYDRILSTKDWFRMDEEGFLYFIGRSDDIIKTRGEKVSPVEVENVLHGIKGVREAAVLGEDDEILGQAIVAYLALDEDAGLTEHDIRRMCAERLENFMVPSRYVFLPELPKTPSGKIRKKGLEELAPR